MCEKFEPPRPNYPEVYTSGGYATRSRAVVDAEARNRQHLEAVIRKAMKSGKEAFDYRKFVEVYWLNDIQSDGLTGKESSVVIESYMKQYYLDYPNVATLAEFARRLEERDMRSGQ